MRPALALLLCTLALAATPVAASTRHVAPGDGVLAAAIAAAAPGDVLLLEEGRHQGPVVLDKPLTLDGLGQAVLDGGGTGSVVTIIGEGAVVRGLTITGSGSDHGNIDSGVQLKVPSKNALVEGNRLIGNLYGVDAHGTVDSTVRNNIIEGRQDRRMNDRGNGVYVWNAPGLLVQGNDVRWGRDGIFVSISRKATFLDNRFRDLRFAIHYMYAHDSEISRNVSIGNHLGFALMYSDRLQVQGNTSLADIGHGLMLNYTNSSDIAGNLVRGADKCLFIYNAHRNIVADNRFEGCDIGIHFTAGSEKNAITGNAFIGNRTQVKYVGTRDIEWSLDGRGNYWSDHPAFDLNGDGMADSAFRPNDLMDHILWSQPSAALLTGAPVVQLVRWSQSSFPATLPGGVVDSAPLMVPLTIDVSPENEALAAAALARGDRKASDVESDALAAH